MRECPETEKYKRYIADLKSIPEDEIPGSILPIDEIIDMLETANRAIGRATKTEVRPIRDHLDYMTRRGVSFDDKKFEHLFNGRNVSANGPVQEPGLCKQVKRRLDYGYREKMAGFVMRSGGLEWDDGRVSDFIEAVRKGNTDGRKNAQTQH